MADESGRLEEKIDGLTALVEVKFDSLETRITEHKEYHDSKLRHHANNDEQAFTGVHKALAGKVSKEAFSPVARVVYGLCAAVGSLLVGCLGAVMFTVISHGH